MKLLVAVIAVTAVSATKFAPNAPPKCFVDSAGRTVVHYLHSQHLSFKCTHSGSTCTCTNKHPTHHKGLCRQFDHTDASTHSINGDCTDTGLSPIDGGYSTWGPCSKSCGTGTQSRTCTNPAPAHGGANCVGATTRSCNTHACPVDCVVGAWSNYGACSATCDGGVQTRSRTITQPQNGGAICTESITTQTRACNTGCCAQALGAQANALATKINKSEKRPITTYSFYKDGNGKIVFSAYGFSEYESINGCRGSGDKKVCLYQDPGTHIAHLEFAIPKGSSIRCNLLHNEDDAVYMSGSRTSYKFLMATDGGNNCGQTGTGQPCIKIANDGAAAGFMQGWASLVVQCVGDPLAVTAPSLTGACASQTTAVKAFADAAKTAVSTLRKVDIYDFHRSGGNDLVFGSTTLPNAFGGGVKCTSFNGGKLCANSAKSGSHAQIEFSLPKGASIQCNLMHYEDDQVYESNGKPRFQLRMATDGGNGCGNTGLGQGCVKIVNDGSDSRAVPAWGGYSIMCLSSAPITDTPASANLDVAATKMSETSAALDDSSVRSTKVQDFWMDGSGNLNVVEAGTTYKVSQNSCSSLPSGKLCMYGNGAAWTLNHGNIRCDLLHSEDDSIYHTASFKGGDAAWYDPIMITDGGNDCPSLLNGKAKLPQGTPCVEIKNAGTQTDRPIYPWQGFALYCIA